MMGRCDRRVKKGEKVNLSHVFCGADRRRAGRARSTRSYTDAETHNTDLDDDETVQ
jgi:hypothetical protein